MSKNGRKIIKAKCPTCEKIYETSFTFEKTYWTGRGMPRKICIACRNTVEQNGMSVKNRTYNTKERTRLLSLIKSRGLTRDQKNKNDRYLEMAGRKLREKIGIKAPPWIWYIPG